MDVVTAANVAKRFFRTNGIYDPDVAPHVAGDGQHQPFGFDQRATLYRRYRVYGMKYKIIFTNTSMAYEIDVGVVHEPNLTASVDMQTVAEKPYTQTRLFGIAANAQSTQVIQGYVSNPKLIGVSEDRYWSDDVFAGGINTLPEVKGYTHIY